MTQGGLSNSIGDAYSTGPVASILASFLLGLLVDRYFSSQKVLAVLHLAGALMLWSLPHLMQPESRTLFLLVLLCYMVCYMPTLALSNNVAFHSLRDGTSGFPMVRVFGSIGWIVAGLVVGKAGLSASASVFHVAAIASAALGAYSLSLPKTPPPAAGQSLALRDLVCADALALLRQRHFLVFTISATLISIPLATYYAYAAPFVGDIGFRDVGSVMSLGQAVEIIFMLLIPFFYRKVGLKAMLLLSMLGWVVRYLLFMGAALPGLAWLAYGSILLHGVCYDFFFVVAFIYTDKVADSQVKGQAQSLTVLFTYGAGMLIGAQASGSLFSHTVARVSSFEQWQHFWMYPAAAAAVVAVGFQLFFNYRERPTERSSNNPAEVSV